MGLICWIFGCKPIEKERLYSRLALVTHDLICTRHTWTECSWCEKRISETKIEETSNVVKKHLSKGKSYECPTCLKSMSPEYGPLDMVRCYDCRTYFDFCNSTTDVPNIINQNPPLFRVEGYCRDTDSWVKESDRLYTLEDIATKAAWRLRINAGVPVRLLCRNAIVWSDSIK